MNTYEEIYHFGIKGQRWGIRRFQNEDGTLTPAGRRRQAQNQKIVSREIEFQNKKIAGLRSQSKAYRDSANQMRTEGVALLKKQGYDEDSAKEAVRLTSGRRDVEADWYDHQAKHLDAYNKRISQIDTSTMTKRQVWQMIQDEGNKTLNDINSTWKEPDITKEYNKARGWS